MALLLKVASIAFPHLCRPAWFKKKTGALSCLVEFGPTLFSMRCISLSVICILSVSDVTLTLFVVQPLLAQFIYLIFLSPVGLHVLL